MPAYRRRLLLAAALTLSAACTRSPDPGPIEAPPVTPLQLTISNLEVVDQVQSLPLNFIDRRRTDEMLAATRTYLTQRLHAGGGSEFGRAVIEEASMVEQAIPRGGITGALTGPTRELVGSLAVRVAIVDGLGIEKAYARAKVERKRPVRDASSVMERDRLARDLVNELLKGLDTSLQSAVRENLGTYLTTS
jgi:hypothetical protein